MGRPRSWYQDEVELARNYSVQGTAFELEVFSLQSDRPPRIVKLLEAEQLTMPNGVSKSSMKACTKCTCMV